MARLQAASQEISNHYNWSDFVLGKVLSQTLLAGPPDRRPGLARRVFADIVKTYPPGPILCTDIDILFEPSLSLDPLGLFRDAGRHKQLVVIWPGAFVDEVLTYATAEHAHYRSWSQPDLCDHCIITL